MTAPPAHQAPAGPPPTAPQGRWRTTRVMPGHVGSSWLWATLWTLLVIGVQPWARADGEGGGVGNVAKGGLLIGVFLVAVMSVRPGFRTKLPAGWRWYVAYAVVGLASALLVINPTSPVIRMGRVFAALLLLATLWSPLMSRPQRLLAAHLIAHTVVAAIVLLGWLVEPQQAFKVISTLGAGNRLQGVLLPMQPPRVGEVGAIIAGLAFVAWLMKKLPTLPAAALFGLGLLLIQASKTRTAAGALLVGLVAALLFTRRTWLGRIAALLLPVAAVGLFLLVPAFNEWVTRGQSSAQLESLSGRTASWGAVIDAKVSTQTWIFGHGLGNKKIILRTGEGVISTMPIDNSWLSLYWETGMLGVVLVAMAFLATAYTALRAKPSVAKAAAWFLLGYVTVASLNESGLSDLSSMTLHLLVAAAFADVARRQSRSGARRRGPVVLRPASVTVIDPAPPPPGRA